VSGEAVEIEASGETVGEARWAALHELERRFPALDRDAVEFVVLSEGKRGLLGVGYEPATVIARLSELPPAPPAGQAPAPAPARRRPPAHDESEHATVVRELLEHVLDGLGLDGDVELEERPGELLAVIHGDDLGLLIGRHGQTIDAIQYLTNSTMFRRFGRGVEVTVDAQGYRLRRERTLGEVAARAVAEVRATGRPVALDPMTAAERKIVHTKVQEMEGMSTASEGAEPNRYVVVQEAEAE